MATQHKDAGRTGGRVDQSLTRMQSANKRLSIAARESRELQHYVATGALPSWHLRYLERCEGDVVAIAAATKNIVAILERDPRVVLMRQTHG
jgi:hypothetical protein